MISETKYCAKHPNTESNLQCGKCDQNVCPRCLVHAPVGIRCPDCAQGNKIPTFDVSASFLARGIGAGIALGLVSGVVISFAINVIPIAFPAQYPLWASLIGMGYVIGEGISISVNRKRGKKLKFVASISTLIAVSIISATLPPHFLDLIYWFAAGGGFWIAIGRFSERA